MTKWLFVLLIAAGAVLHFTGQKRVPEPQDIPPQETQTPARDRASSQAPAQTSSRVPSEVQCRSIGGRMVSGMGCVVGAPAGDANPQIAPAAMEEHCRSSGKRYVRELNACVSS